MFMLLFVLPYRSVFVFVLLNKENIFLEKELSFYCVIKEGRSLFVFQEVLQKIKKNEYVRPGDKRREPSGRVQGVRQSSGQGTREPSPVDASHDADSS